MLEPYDGKLSCTVLRRGSGSNPADLAGKAVSNALKGRLFPDDNQYDLGLVLLSRRSRDCTTHISVLDMEDLGQFLASYVTGPIGRNGYFDL